MAAGIAVVLIALASGGAQAVIALAVAILVGVTAYASMFTWMGLMSSKALGFALVYVFLWEQFLTRFIRGIRYFSIREYMVSILHGLDEGQFGFFGTRTIEFEAAVVAASIVIIGFLLLTIRRLNRMDIP